MLKYMDEELVEILLDSMQRQGIEVRQNSPHSRVVKNWNDSLTIVLESGETINVEKCLVCQGRSPNLDSLCLD